MAEPNPGDVLTAMVNALQAFVPPQVAGLPEPSLSLARAELRASGIGNYVGARAHGAIAATELQALRVDAVARFSLWGFVPADVDTAVNALTGAIFASRATLQAQGFLKLAFEGSSHIEESKQPVAWRRFADYALLYEFAYEDIGGAAALIRPVQAREARTGAAWTVSADLARWDDDAAAALSLRGPASFSALAALAFIATPALPPTGGVTITRTFDAASPAPAAATLATFLAAVTDPVAPARSLAVSFASVTDLLAQFTPDGPPLAMGDRDADGAADPYSPSILAFPAALLLTSVFDRLEITFDQPKFDHIAVVYLRAVRSGG